MRVDVVIKEKKKQGLGVGLLLFLAAMFTAAYLLGEPERAAGFPRPIEKALSSFRSEADKMIDSVGIRAGEVYRMVAGY
jgi:hypothetical protein